jgi:hypothetical protein
VRYPNTLIVGTTPSSTLARLTSQLNRPLSRCRLPGPLELPETGTLVLENLDGLTPAQQRELSNWMDAHDLTIVSLSRDPVYPLVQQGHFDDQLFYRLNTIVEGEEVETV